MSEAKNELLGRRGELLRDILKIRRNIRIATEGKSNVEIVLANNRAELSKAEKELTEVDNESGGSDRSIA